MDNLQNEIQELKKLLLESNLNSKELFNVDDATLYLDISKSCLYKLTSRREIPFYTPGGKKIYFKKSEIDTWVFNSRVESVNDIERDVEHYLSRIKTL